jgi:sec-independent protein translocase protein TatA
MGIGNIGWFQILVILLIVLLVFGTKRIRNIGSDLGGAIREFRKGVGDDDDTGSDKKAESGADASASSDSDDESNAKQGR